MIDNGLKESESTSDINHEGREFSLQQCTIKLKRFDILFTSKISRKNSLLFQNIRINFS